MYKKGKQLLAIMLMLALCFTTASMAFAQKAGGVPNSMGNMGRGGDHGGGHHGKNALTVKGTVVAVDPASITITVTHANHAQSGLVGQNVTFAIDPDVVVMVMGFGLSTLDDILVEDVVKVMAKSVQGEYVAYRIMVF